jgi:hypothetical protein
MDNHIPVPIYRALISLVGTHELVFKWWDSPNKGFQGRCPKDVPIEEVRDYILQALSH